jgi:hypothetical protein
MIAKKGEYARRAVGIVLVEQKTGADRRTEIGTPVNGMISKIACSDAPGTYLSTWYLSQRSNHSGHKSLTKYV